MTGNRWRTRLSPRDVAKEPFDMLKKNGLIVSKPELPLYLHHPKKGAEPGERVKRHVELSVHQTGWQADRDDCNCKDYEDCSVQTRNGMKVKAQINPRKGGATT